MRKPLPARLAAGLAFLFAASHGWLLAQSAPCPPPAALIVPDNPAYADALDMQRKLEADGFVVECIFETKLSSQFLTWENGIPHSTIEGEACFRTSYGDFDVIFVPKPQTFADLKIKEHRDGGGYTYTFSGMPSIWRMKRWESARREYFLKHENYLLSVSDANLRVRVEDVLRLE